MKFSSREDIDAPIERVFDHLTDFAQFEQRAIERGVDLKRTDDLTAPGTGASWDAAFKLRGKQRQLSLVVTKFARPTDLLIEGSSKAIHTEFLIEMTALTESKTRMSVTLELRPKSLAMRLMLQSLKVAKSNLNKRFKLRAAEHARQLEQSLTQDAG